MNALRRREFLSDVGRGMLAAGLGASLADDLGFSPTFAAEGAAEIPLGKYAALVELMRSQAPEKLQPTLARKVMDNQVDLKSLIGAGALANAVTFGGCDYVGFHTAMAMLPALEMSRRLPDSRKPLPVLKVLYRNSQQIQSVGGASKKVLEAIHAAEHSSEGDIDLQIRDACRKLDVARGEQLLAKVGDSRDQFDALQPAIQDDLNVHRFVFAYRTYGLVGLLGEEHAYSMLRQCVRLCADHEKEHVRHNHPPSPIRALVPKLLDQYKLVGKTLGKRDPGDDAVDKLSAAIFKDRGEKAAEAVAAALADGIDPEVVGEALALASNLYVLRQGPDQWRAHGDAAGVHSSDATNAWRNMLRLAAPKYVASGLIVAAYHVGVQSPPYATPPYPTDDHRKKVTARDQAGLLRETEDAIRHNDQGRAAAAMRIYGELGFPVDAALALMLNFAISEDGRLHGEKYFQTVCDEYRAIRPAFRWRQIVGLARVTASAYGYNRDDKRGFRAAGYDDACRILGVPA